MVVLFTGSHLGCRSAQPQANRWHPFRMPRVAFIPKGLQPLAWGRCDPRSPSPQFLRLRRSRSDRCNPAHRSNHCTGACSDSTDTNPRRNKISSNTLTEFQRQPQLPISLLADHPAETTKVAKLGRWVCPRQLWLDPDAQSRHSRVIA